MKCSPKTKKIVSIFLLVNILQSVILPSVANALTSGPTAPEASSFEPIDTTDMVSLQTGDFTYSIPLLEVPSPEGGYPLALAYHGGVKPLEEASWVGLGWSLSPGAISRVVNGYPDDQVGASRYVTDKWDGGETKSFSIGTTIGIPNSPVGFSLAYTATHDTYKGFSGDVAFGVNYGIGGVNVSTNGQASASLGPAKFSADIESGKQAVTIGYTSGYASIDLTLSSGGQVDAGVSLLGQSLEYDFSSKKLKPSFSVAGVQIQTVNNNYGNISTSGYGFTIPIPVPWGSVNLSYHYQRYWMDVRDQTYVTGSLQPGEFNSAISGSILTQNNRYKKLDETSQQSFDKVTLTEVTNPASAPYGSTVGNYNDPSWQLGGAIPSFDSYQVTGQGVSGSIRPYIFNNYSLVSKESVH